MMPGQHECAHVVRWQAADHHRQLLIATDLEEACVAQPILEHLDRSARIAVLGSYRIPFGGLHTLVGTPRLERALEVRTREAMLAFVQSSGLASSRFELLTCHGDLHDHVIREARTRCSDLVVLALVGCSCRAQQRIAMRLLAETRCDLVIVEGDRARPGWYDDEALVAHGPWAC